MSTTFTLVMKKEKEVVKLQCKVPKELEEHIKLQPDYKSMNSYIKSAIIKKSKFKNISQAG